MSNSLLHHGLQHARPPCPSPTPGVHSNSCPSSRSCHPAISSSVVPFSSCPQSFPASGSFFFFFIFFFKFYFIFKLYIIVLVLPNIKMNPPQVYMCSPSWTLLPPHIIPLGRPSALAPSIQFRALNLDWQLVSYMIFYMFQCHSPKSSHPLPLPQSP